MSSLKSRVLVSVIGIPVLVAIVLWTPSVVLLAAVALLAGIGAVELQQCVSGEKGGVMSAAGAAMAIFTVFGYYAQPAWIPGLLMLGSMVLFGYAIIKGGSVNFGQLMAAVFGSFAIGYAFSAFLRIEAMDLHRTWLLLPFILSFGCDTFAYFVGCSMGKHKLAPKVSPKKSVEGAVGGLLGNVLCGCVFLSLMNRLFGGTIDYSAMVILALVCGIVAQIGDLSFSLIKREFGIKDYGKIFLAHGGVLDRFDSVLFVAPMIEMILNIVR